MEKEAPQGELALCCRPAAAEDFPFLFSVLKEVYAGIVSGSFR